ncbi:unknown [Crocosphaera subtropica ATCC 51142]|uniref:Outer membrane efflux protein n=1 Tax=Crocosphaera subtropica (strain ATCC 51142 / BH68) TaxID=43989 RepID=B1WS48_CROS5|nr:TolC family protein [Crocosphaera subtropica]ACB50242.1 unknown [Crocosphaera subtropica ATCC 51142]
MFVLRYCVCASVSLLSALSWNTGLMAQTVSSVEGESEAAKLLLQPNSSLKSQPRVSDIKRMKDASVSSETKKKTTTPLKAKKNLDQRMRMVSQSTTPPSLEASEAYSETILEQLPPNNLNPNGNPLLFPTKPENVETTINQPVTLGEVIALALQNNREIQEARIAVEEVKARLVQERAALYPTIDVDSRINRDFIERQTGDFTRGIPETVVESRQTTGIFNVALQYDIYSGGERDGSIKRAEREIRDRQLELERISEQVRFEATDNYYLLQNADAQVAIAQADVENASQTLRDAQLLEQAGLGTRFDVLRAEGDLAAANEELTRAIAEQRTARRRLAETLSVGQHVQLVAADEITESGNWKLSLEETIVQAYKNRAELEQQLVQREIGQQDRRIAMAGIIPQLDFLAQYGFDDDLDNGLGALVNYRFETRLTWRLFDGGRAFAGARAAERRMDQANIRFADLRNEIRFQVEEAYYSLIANQENISSTRQNVATREEALRLARLRFQAGVGTQTDVINAQRDLSQARGNFLQAIIQYNQSLNALQRAVSNYPDNRLFEMR